LNEARPRERLGSGWGSCSRFGDADGSLPNDVDAFARKSDTRPSRASETPIEQRRYEPIDAPRDPTRGDPSPLPPPVGPGTRGRGR
jgi:hypothetical protein